MEARRPVLLYETDHRALLEACRELSRQVAEGKLEPGMYGRGNRKKNTRQLPQLILDLEPLRVDIEKDGQVDIIMSPVVMYGVCAFPEDYEGSLDELYKYGDEVWGIELIDGLWYYDEDFQKHPEHKKEVEELLKKRKTGDSSGVPRKAIFALNRNPIGFYIISKVMVVDEYANSSNKGCIRKTVQKV
jgi:hypothetical protein